MVERCRPGLLVSAVMKLAASLLIVGFATTCLVRLAPGFGVDERELDSRLSTESINELQKPAGDENVFIGYYRYLRRAAHGDLGWSKSLNRPVSELIQQRYRKSVRILTLGLMAGWLNAFVLASTGALLQTRVVPFTGTIAGAFILCIPSALLAWLCYLARAPAFLVVALVIFARTFRVIDNLFQAAREQSHILAARAYGVREFRIFTRHILSITRAELIALAGSSVSMALGATIAAEALCDEPGLGQLAWKASLARDLPLLVSLTLLMAAVSLICNRSADAFGQFRRASA